MVKKKFTSSKTIKGRTYQYFRKDGRYVRLPDDPNSEEYDREYWRLMRGPVSVSGICRAQAKRDCPRCEKRAGTLAPARSCISCIGLPQEGSVLGGGAIQALQQPVSQQLACNVWQEMACLRSKFCIAHSG